MLTLKQFTWIMIFCHFICLLCNLRIFHIGVFFTDASGHENAVHTVLKSIEIAFGLVGSLVFVLCLVSLYPKNVRLLVLSLVLLYAAIVCQIVLALWMYLNEENLVMGIMTTLILNWKDVSTEAGSIGSYEKAYECCGFESYEDYELMDRKVPPTCFTNGELHNSGCMASFQEHWEGTVDAYIWIFRVTICLEVIVSIVFIWYCHIVRILKLAGDIEEQ